MKDESFVSEFCADIENIIAHEAFARRSYYDLQAKYGKLIYSDEIAQLNEIIAEELKHSEILRDMIYRRTKILPEE